MKTVILAEKPSQANDYARCFKKSVRKSGYYQIEDPLFQGTTVVTYGFGHLVELVSPEKYDEKWGNFSVENLPIFPEEYRFEVPEDKKKQFSVVKKQLCSADTIIIATDCDREGENIAWSIIKQAGALSENKQIKRLWINSMEKEVIYKGFQNLLPGKQHYPMYEEAKARQISDWLIGMNASPLYTQHLRNKGIQGIFSVGRVQTPTLYMIYQLQREIQQFKPEPFFEVSAKVKAKEQVFAAKLEPNTKFPTFQELRSFLEGKEVAFRDQPGKIMQVEKTIKETASPKLFSLTRLQAKMNKLAKASAKETLQAVQKLYEAKLLSYPRSSTTYITENEFGYLKEQLAKYKEYLNVQQMETPAMEPKKRFVNNKEVKEHYAIIPTRVIPSSEQLEKLSPLERQVYQEVVKRTVAMFSSSYEYEETTIITGVKEIQFKTVGKTPKKLGWKELYTNEKSDEENEILLPRVCQGDLVQIDVQMKEKETAPPKPYTEATLLLAMQNIGNKLDDPDAKELLKKTKGIGTEATRADIIEALKQREFIQIVKNNIVVTKKGIALCKATGKEKLLSSAEMTAEWENYLEKIGRQEGSQKVFINNTKKFIVHLLEVVPGQFEDLNFGELLQDFEDEKRRKEEESNLGLCPKCKDGQVKMHKKLAACTNDSCDFKIWRTMAKKKLPKTALKDLVKSGRSKREVKGFSGKKGTFDAFVVLTSDFSTEFEFSKSKKEDAK